MRAITRLSPFFWFITFILSAISFCKLHLCGVDNGGLAPLNLVITEGELLHLEGITSEYRLSPECDNWLTELYRAYGLLALGHLRTSSPQARYHEVNQFSSEGERGYRMVIPEGLSS